MDFGLVCDFWQSSSSTWQVLDPTGQLEACCVWWTDLTSPFLPARFHLFSHLLNFFWGGPPGPLRTPGPRGTCPGYPPLSVGLMVTTCLENLEMSGNLTAVRDFTISQGSVMTKISSAKSGLNLFIISYVFASILDFAELVHFILVLDHAPTPPLTITLVQAWYE